MWCCATATSCCPCTSVLADLTSSRNRERLFFTDWRSRSRSRCRCVGACVRDMILAVSYTLGSMRGKNSPFHSISFYLNSHIPSYHFSHLAPIVRGTHLGCSEMRLSLGRYSPGHTILHHDFGNDVLSRQFKIAHKDSIISFIHHRSIRNRHSQKSTSNLGVLWPLVSVWRNGRGWGLPLVVSLSLLTQRNLSLQWNINPRLFEHHNRVFNLVCTREWR
jgi:hypothetical protein